MEQTNTPQQPSRKKAILSLLVLLALTCVVVFIFSSHWAEISTALAQPLLLAGAAGAGHRLDLPPA